MNFTLQVDEVEIIITKEISLYKLLDPTEVGRLSSPPT